MSYAEVIMRMANAVKPGSCQYVRIYHDDNCTIWKTRECSCEPEVHIMSDAEF